MNDLYPSRRQAVPATGERRQAGSQRHDFVAVAEQTEHQDVLRHLLKTNGRFTHALLVPEPDHSLAVAVTIEDQKVGYLSPDVAEKYGPLLRAMPNAMMVPAELSGGEWDKPTVGVVLDFSLVYAAARQSETV